MTWSFTCYILYYMYLYFNSSAGYVILSQISQRPSLLLHSPCCYACQNVFLEENIEGNGRDHDDDNACCQCLPGALLCIGIIHQEGCQCTQFILRHVQIGNIHIIDNIDRLDDTYRRRCR